ncbi:4-hydroxy-3-methylbut-2-enyl diphosphate reductase [bacterium]|nr:4-hydroxy-3-methylbut-2-enyl diphosphate reductase [bacterium]
MPFEIRVAETAGFCFGVKKALDKLLEILNKSSQPVRTLGPLIHNEQVLEALKKRAVEELSSCEDVSGKHVILRAHGVTPDTRKELKRENAIVCDATCPKVGQVQAIVKKFSRKNCPVVIIGDRDHAEVDGLLGYSAGMGMVVSGPEEANKLPGGEAICIVAQTTQDSHVFNQVVTILKSKYRQCYEFNTICDATFERQEESRSLAVQSDIMIIVGGTHSANTKRLVDIAAGHCKTVMIQKADDLSADMFAGVQKVGITAGASTPTWVIRDVVDKVYTIGWRQVGPVVTRCFNLVN